MLFPEKLLASALIVEARLSEVLANTKIAGAPDRLSAAMGHAVFAGGKRFRPFLVLECAGLFGGAPAAAVDAAAAIECIHCYSLVHDDLPQMDNDMLRRGQPTVWKAFDEWTAILAGDALQTLAFELLGSPRCHDDARVRSDLVVALARAAGASGMAGGQALDLEAEKLSPDAAPNLAHIAHLQSLKTGRLIRVGCEMGAILGGANLEQRAALTSYGECLGFAFQISDDLLDAEGKAENVGKATGKDAAAGKATLVSLVGIERAREHMDKVVATAIEALTPFGDKADVLAEAARFMGRRGH